MPETKASLLDRVIFTSGDRTFTVSDVLDAAFIRGHLRTQWERVLAGLAAERVAIEQELEYEQEALDQAAVTFRYAHDLITAEETERWLEERHVTLHDFASWFARDHWRTQLADKATQAAVPYPGAPVEMREALVAHLTFSDQLDDIAVQISWRVAAPKSANAHEPDAAATAAKRAELLETAGISEGGLTEALSAMGRDAEWLDEQARLEVAYGSIAGNLLTPHERERELNKLRLPLTRFDLETIELDSDDAAKEAMFCVREDGMSMEEVAAEGRYPYRRAEIVLEDISDDLQQRFLNVRPGTLIDPIQRGDGVELCRVIGKTEPSQDDPAVHRRIDTRILNRYFEELTAKNISWSLLRSE